MMGEVKVEIENAIKTLSLTDADIRLLDDSIGEGIFRECLNHFVKSGDRRWWWEDFKQPYFLFKEFERPFEQLYDIMPLVSGMIWLIVEDDQEPFYPVYEVKPEIVSKVVGECFAFEYYIIDKHKEWLLCENHHNSLIGVGVKLKELNLDKLTSAKLK